MSIRLRHLRLRAETPNGPYGVDLGFQSGLVVIRADNTSGKSTCVQAIVFALGLEAMLTVRHDVPLPPAMTARLIDEKGREIPVLESYVACELENSDGEFLTVQRWAKHPTIQPKLVVAWDGPALTQPGSHYNRKDYFVRQPGAATSEGGFHSRLARFLGWQLPVLTKTDGSEVPLYVELLFPLLFVEQKRGWGGIQAQMPIFPGIPEPRKRAVEFILGLEAYDRVNERLALRLEQQRLVSSWAAARDAFEHSLAGSAVSSQNIPTDPTISWPPAIAPSLRVATAGTWVALDSHVRDLRRLLAKLRNEPVPTVQVAAPDLQRQLREQEQELGEIGAVSAQALEESRLSREQLESLDRRLEALSEDLQRYQDTRRLEQLGGGGTTRIVEDTCPTCHQALPPVLVEREAVPTAMSVDENIRFISDQIQTFNLIREDSLRSLEAARAKLSALRKRSDELRGTIRAIRDSLVSPSATPSIAALKERLQLERTIAELRTLEERFAGFLEQLGLLSGRFRGVRERLQSLQGDDLSSTDSRKLEALQRSFLDQLGSYGFRSFPVDSIELSRSTYLPGREGFDLGVDVSASDWIRVVWAYLLALLEVARSEQTNHPRLLVFDEPRQQSADPVSLAALLARASRASEFREQVIFATSEPDASLRAMLRSLPCQLLSFDGKILKRVGSSRQVPSL